MSKKTKYDEVEKRKNNFTVLENDSEASDDHVDKTDKPDHLDKIPEKKESKFMPSVDPKFTKDQSDKFKKSLVPKKIYDEETKDETTDLGNTLYLHSIWSVFIHSVDCPDWTESSYTHIYTINSIGSFWRFFNNFHLLDKSKNQIFIMRNKIKPIWEDNNNRNGGICSIKMECQSKAGRTDLSTEVMTCICLLVMNETFILDNEEINGISYAIKNRNVLIKLWCKNYTNNVSEKLPLGLMHKIDTILQNSDRIKRYHDSKLSIKYMQIKPEYEVK